MISAAEGGVIPSWRRFYELCELSRYRTRGANQPTRSRSMAGGKAGGLVFILSIFAAVVLLFTGKYPGDLFKLVTGTNRWSLRVAAYAALMTDEYPPFRFWDE